MLHTINDSKTLDLLLAKYAAPTLLRLKSASLFSVRQPDAQRMPAFAAEFNQRGRRRGLTMRVLCQCTQRSLVYVYDRMRLRRELASPARRQLLRQFGYGGLSLSAMLDRLGEKIAQGGDFPHEIGLFLGYPTADVEGFIRHGGENYKVCGHWKVYGDEERARRCFASYNQCRSRLCEFVDGGMSIYEALKLS